MRLIASTMAVAAAMAVATTVFAQEASTGSGVCTGGQLVSADTAGHCCWPGQVWANSRQVCVGVPQCPAGLAPHGEMCAPPECPPGETSTPDTAGHCCWPAQVWSKSRAKCVGVPQCPAGLVAMGEMCAAPAPGAAPPAAGNRASESADGKVPVRVVGAQWTEVTFLPSGQAPVKCTMVNLSADSTPMDPKGEPCSLKRPPGSLRVEVARGGVHYERTIELPPSPTTLNVAVRSPVGLPIAVAVIGGVSLGVGLPLWAASDWSTHSGAGIAGTALTTSGGSMVLLSAFLFPFIGRNKIEISPTLRALSDGNVRVGVVPIRGGSAAGLSFQF